MLWQSTESLNSGQRAHDGSGPMGFKRINIQVTASRGASWGDSIALWVGEKEKQKQKNTKLSVQSEYSMAVMISFCKFDFQGVEYFSKPLNFSLWADN